MQNFSSLFGDLENQGWGVADAALPAGLADGLLQECQRSWQAGAFHEAHVGRGAGKNLSTVIRGDSILWLETENAQQYVNEFFAWAADLRSALNQRYFLGLKSEEFHFARYPAGNGYQKHLDQHRGQNERKISLVLYLNPDWKDADGGQLRLFSPDDPDKEVALISPRMGRLVLFKSDVVPHEVLPCFQIRSSLTGWYRTDF